MVKTKKTIPKQGNLGRSLIKEKNAIRRGMGVKHTSWLHTSEVPDGDWNRLNLQSVTEQTTLDEFLETAELAGIEFTAEKQNVCIIGTGTIPGVLGKSEREELKTQHELNKGFVTIPRRPTWDESTTPEQLELKEREVFLNWRRSLALLQEEKELLLTPYEKNLDVWRQLWRVVERSDVVCQIVDARNPLLYKCDDLEVYIQETNPSKSFMVLVNKADYLNEDQRNHWLAYFNENRTKVIFWSALTEIESKAEDEDVDEDEELVDHLVNLTTDGTPVDTSHVFNSTQLMSHFKTYKAICDDNNRVTIGLVGYPNVGKSSTINALLKQKKTAVSATPGKTKHFQTHLLDDDICLCDCPGLVFPSFISTKADMVLNGILPVDQMKDHVAPSTVLAQLIPRAVVESTYGINIPTPGEGENRDRCPTAEEMLSSYAKMRGFMTANGIPDCPRASRYLLKDFIKGKLLYCHPPPGVSSDDFQPCQMIDRIQEELKKREEKRRTNTKNDVTNEVDSEFFTEKPAGFGYKGGHCQQTADDRLREKAWKKHGNRNKKEKLRRIYDKK